MKRSTRRHIARIETDFEEITGLLGDHQLASLQTAKVSDWCLGEHLEHILATNELILRGFDSMLADPTRHRHRAPNLHGRLVLLLSKIPRGKAQAMDYLQPVNAPLDELEPRHTEVQRRLRQLAANLQRGPGPTARMLHPYLGYYDIYQWLHFFWVHQHHHLLIIRDIRSHSV